MRAEVDSDDHGADHGAGKAARQGHDVHVPKEGEVDVGAVVRHADASIGRSTGIVPQIRVAR